MESKVTQYAEQQLIEAAKRMTREQRLAGFIEHNRKVHELFEAGKPMRDANKKILDGAMRAPNKKDIRATS